MGNDNEEQRRRAAERSRLEHAETVGDDGTVDGMATISESRTVSDATLDGAATVVDDGPPAPQRRRATPLPIDDDEDDEAAPAAPRHAFSPGWFATLLAALALLVGASFAGRSTADFATHLDGQVHALSCSVLPGGEAQIGASGCKAAMMSPYSSIWRDRVWGGVPVALPGFAVFCLLAALALYLVWLPGRSRRESGWLLLATTLPLGTSGVFAWISANEVGSFCTLCVGIYVSSGVAWLMALVATIQADRGQGPLPWARWLLWTVEGVVAVGLVVQAWMAWAPTDRPSLKGCGSLVQTKDEAGILVPLPRAADATPSLMVIDPLCPACRAFERRLGESGLESKLARDLLLFPLDSSCNWMVKSSLHPGACALSEAILCAPASAEQILDWAFAEQERLLALGKSDEVALRAEVKTKFPALASCLGSAEVKAKLNKSLRFAVANALAVSTPQLFVRETRLCDEDTDLGLEFALGRLLSAETPGTPGTPPAAAVGGGAQ